MLSLGDKSYLYKSIYIDVRNLKKLKQYGKILKHLNAYYKDFNSGPETFSLHILQGHLSNVRFLISFFNPSKDSTLPYSRPDISPCSLLQTDGSLPMDSCHSCLHNPQHMYRQL